MNCSDFNRHLAENQPPSPEATKHVETCAGCRAMLNVLQIQPDPPLSPEALRRIVDSLPPARPVNPLPSDRVLVAIALVLFAVFCLGVTALVRFSGFQILDAAQRLLYYVPVLAFSLLFANALPGLIIPGAKVRPSPGILAVASVFVIGAAVSALFPFAGQDQFVAQGIPCLRFGCLCAIAFSVIMAFLLRRGYVTNRRSASLWTACFAAFSGIAILSLHCPIEYSAHIIVWHLGVMAVCAFAGLVIGRVLEPQR